ncbi:MAG: RagB/SusD family nutrient uptake outer membrane protein [Saprospiraceae bacterium]
MKKYTLLLLLSILSFQSCKEEKLDVEPVGEFLSSNFFITEDQVFSALIASYDPLAWSMAYGQWISYVMFAEIRSDNANAGGDKTNTDQPGWQELDDFRETNSNVVLQPLYRRNYIGIFRANTVLENARVESGLVDQYKAEAKFLRAYYHFELFRHFGPIPVVTELLAPDEVTMERNTVSEVFEAITTDLEEAIPLLPTTVSAGDEGRVTKGAALAFLGKAYLYWADLLNDDQAKFDLAADALQQVIDLGVYELEEDLQTIFNLNVRNTKESVFEIQHTNLWSSDWGWFEGIDGNGVIQLCGVRGLCADHPDYIDGWGFMLPTQSLYDHYLSDDTYRRDVAMTDEAELAAEVSAAGNSCSTVVDQAEQNPADYTGFWQEKFANYKGYEGNNVNGGDPFLTKAHNTFPMRYANVLLMLAEANIRGTGGEGAAMPFIDEVRERAAGPDATTFRSASQVMTDEGWSALDLIWYERRAEFAMEGDRWFDLVRSGRLEASLFDADRAANFSDDKMWLPISLDETTVAKELTTQPDASLFQ